jgi:quinol monooxygenase YgiN
VFRSQRRGGAVVCPLRIDSLNLWDLPGIWNLGFAISAVRRWDLELGIWDFRIEHEDQRGDHYRLDSFYGDVHVARMNPLSNFVSLHPYFKVHPGKLEAFKAAFPAFIEKTATEEKNLFYGFTINGDEVFCREGYTDAEGVLAHLDNVGAMLAEALKIGDLIRLELHGPANELDKLRKPLAHLNPVWFVIERERK